MRARRTLSHSLLMSELFAQLTFPHNPPEIENRIESLINGGYV